MTSSMTNMLWMSGLILACLLFYRYGLPRLRKFDQNNIERIAQNERDRSDPSAHLRHALDVASEQVDAFCIGEKVLKEASIDRQPVDLGLKEALDGAVTGSFVAPSRDTSLSNASAHGEHGRDNMGELPTGRFGQHTLQTHHQG